MSFADLRKQKARKFSNFFRAALEVKFSHLTIFFSNFSDSGSGSAADKVSFADLRKQKARDQFHSSGINITYTEQEKEDVPKKSTGSLLASRRDSQQSQRLPQTESSAASTTSEGPQTSPGPGKT